MCKCECCKTCKRHEPNRFAIKSELDDKIRSMIHIALGKTLLPKYELRMDGTTAKVCYRTSGSKIGELFVHWDNKTIFLSNFQCVHEQNEVQEIISTLGIEVQIDDNDEELMYFKRSL